MCACPAVLTKYLNVFDYNEPQSVFGGMPLEYVFYLDLFFLHVFFLNLLSLTLTGSLGRMEGTPGRILAAAAAGSLWNCILFLFPVLPAPVEVLLTVFFMGSVMTSFSFSLGTAREILVGDGLLAASVFFTGGILGFLKENFWLTDLEGIWALAAMSLGGCVFFRHVLKEKARGSERYSVWLTYRGSRKEFLALADSGNRLREPVTGKPVSVIGVESCRGFCEMVSGIFMIPYRAVGTGDGMLPGIVFEKMEIRKGGRLLEIEKPIVAVSKEPLSGSGDFSMLIPEEFITSRSGWKHGLRRKKEESI